MLSESSQTLKSTNTSFHSHEILRIGESVGWWLPGAGGGEWGAAAERVQGFLLGGDGNVWEVDTGGGRTTL